MKSPVGWLSVSSKKKAVSSKGKRSAGEVLVGIEFVGSDRKLSKEKGRVVRQLKEYFEGKRTKFDVKVGFGEGTEFQRSVWRVISKIPFGKTITYKELARRAGRPTAIRAAASACGKNPVPIVVPCHRVVGNGRGPSTGSGLKNLGGYSGGLSKKRWLLQHEGLF